MLSAEISIHDETINNASDKAFAKKYNRIASKISINALKIFILTSIALSGCAGNANSTNEVPSATPTPFADEFVAMDARHLQIQTAVSLQQQDTSIIPIVPEACRDTAVIIWSITNLNPSGSPRSGGLVLRERLNDNNEEYLFLVGNHTASVHRIGDEIIIGTELNEDNIPVNGTSLIITEIQEISGNDTNFIDAAFVTARSVNGQTLDPMIKSIEIANLRGYLESRPTLLVLYHNPSFAGIKTLVLSQVDMQSLSIVLELHPELSPPQSLEEIHGQIDHNSPSVTKGSSSAEVCGKNDVNQNGFVVGVVTGDGDGIKNSIFNFDFAPLPDNIQTIAEQIYSGMID